MPRPASAFERKHRLQDVAEECRVLRATDRIKACRMQPWFPRPGRHYLLVDEDNDKQLMYQIFTSHKAAVENLTQSTIWLGLPTLWEAQHLALLIQEQQTSDPSNTQIAAGSKRGASAGPY